MDLPFGSGAGTFCLGTGSGVVFLASGTRVLFFGVGTGAFFLCGLTLDSDCSYSGGGRQSDICVYNCYSFTHMHASITLIALYSH